MLVRDDDWLRADGTTLGADDGVAIAAMMALVEDESLPHGPLGAADDGGRGGRARGCNALDPKLVTGSIVNLDSEEDGRLTVGCAGSTDTWVRARPRGLPLPTPWRAIRHGSRGAGRALGVGHCAQPFECGRNRQACAASGVREGAVPPRLAERGQSRNAIPRDASAVVSVEPRNEAALREALGSGEPDHPGRVRRRPMPVSRSRSRQRLPGHESRRGRTTRPG